MFVLGFILGGSFGAVVMALFKINGNEPTTILYQPSCNLPECQIYPSYGCIDSTFCKGNPQLCENAILKEEEHE